ncbi:hypothetical protein CANCADRAFT_125695 [Tortispora caseinolytica NRRL Y-17796]|uniref:Uncharacterized protein n=1 Tax=Tortispora caseinolytica NRRL Y-17796 TaxID=767744 RepID=A0A1E4TA77_9ASCO|nr:hypothetical protein CANCADRAFT_125695 [Tortispora caseinolytica NRRL Y-17796]
MATNDAADNRPALHSAHQLAKKANRLAVGGEYAKAARLNQMAAEQLQQAHDASTDPVARKILASMRDSYLKSAQELARVPKTKTPTETPSREPVGGGSTPSVQPSGAPGSRPASATGLAKGSVPMSPSDIVDKFSTALELRFSKLTVSPTSSAGRAAAAAAASAAGHTDNKSDSFYVVPQNSKNAEELAIENAALRGSVTDLVAKLQAYESFIHREKIAIRAAVAKLKEDLANAERSRASDLDSQLMDLQLELNKTKVQYGRLKARWDNLKESARKRKSLEQVSESAELE